MAAPGKHDPRRDLLRALVDAVAASEGEEGPATRDAEAGESGNGARVAGDGDGREGGPARKGALRRARDQFTDLTGREPESVLAVETTDDGWRLTFEVVELERIPSTTDVLAAYEVEVDENGDLRRYAQIRRYRRNQPDEQGTL